MKILVAGGGAFGKEHLRTLAAMGGITLALAEPRADEREHLAASYPLVTAGADAIALLEAGLAPDGIVIATPAAAHAPLALAALARGIPVLVEKPVAPDTATMRRLCDAAAHSRAFLQPGHILRFSASHRHLHDCVSRGDIGTLLTVSSRRYRDASHAERYRDVDPVFTTMVHDIDLALWYGGGDVVSVRATRLPQDERRALTIAEMTASSGVRWSLAMAWLHPDLDVPPDRVELVGTTGSIEFHAGRDIDLYARDGHRRLAVDAADDPLHTELETFLAGIRARRLLAPVTPEDALRGLDAAERIVAAIAA